MILRKFSLVIALLLSMCFVYAQGTQIDVIINNECPDACGYHIDITLHQPNATPSQGYLSYDIPASGTPNTMHLEFDGVDICIDEIECTYLDTCSNCETSATLDVKCYNFNNISDAIAPYSGGPHGKCYTFEYDDFDDPNYCKYLYYYFSIHL
ncbi:MAG: hypothetical protein K9H64_19605 [Bacteroidales bacterium]|nr:hypothetical protein [Bacteroidales bacterium]MCF8458290.1 hypothetical protein [Bacteroidales bacterium]